VNLWAFFSTDPNSASKLAFYDTHIKFLPQKIVVVLLALFANLKVEFRRYGSKNEKYILKMGLRIPFCIHFQSGRLHFIKKGQNRCTLKYSVHYTTTCRVCTRNYCLYFYFSPSLSPPPPHLSTIILTKGVGPSTTSARARIFKCSWGPGIDSKE
jgi:hypothetical protein